MEGRKDKWEREVREEKIKGEGRKEKQENKQKA